MKKRSERAARRARERAREKLGRAREKLWRLEPGGSPSRPLEVSSASVIEPCASSEPCLACGSGVRVSDHRAETVEGRRLRVVETACVQCGARRTWYFRLAAELLS